MDPVTTAYLLLCGALSIIGIGACGMMYLAIRFKQSIEKRI